MDAVKLPYISVIIGNGGDRGHWPLPPMAQSTSRHELPPLSLTRPANYSHMNCPPDLKRATVHMVIEHTIDVKKRKKDLTSFKAPDSD